MSCVRPDRLADYARGRLGARRARAVERHLPACARCREVLARVEAAQAAMRAALEQPVPDVGSVRTEAALRWARPPERPPVRASFVAALGVALTGAAALVAWLGGAPEVPPPVAPKVAVAPRPVESAAVVTLVSGRVVVRRDGETVLVPGARLRSGDAVETAADARVAAQWAPGAGLLLRARASLGLESISTEGVTLALDRGQVDVRVPARDPALPFAERREALSVTTPAHVVTVRGTWFTVAAEAARTTVEVLEGVVEVAERDGSASTLLRAPARAVFGRGRAETQALSAQRAAALRESSAMNLLPSLDGAGVLSVSTQPEGVLAIGGVRLGATPVALLQPHGRHYLEIDRDGFAPLKRWLTVGAEPSALREALVRAPGFAGSGDAPAAIEEVVQRRAHRIRACYERSLKRDPSIAGTVSLALKVGGGGRVSQARVESSTLDDDAVGACLEHEASRWRLAAPEGSTVVYPFVFRPQLD